MSIETQVRTQGCALRIFLRVAISKIRLLSKKKHSEFSANISSSEFDEFRWKRSENMASFDHLCSALRQCLLALLDDSPHKC